MSDSFRYGNKKEINYELFVQKMKNVQTSTNADLWKLFGVFDRDKNGKIENTTKELEVKSLFNFIKNYAGEDNVLDDSEIEKMLKDPQIASQFENKEGIIGALKEFFNNFGTDSVEIKRENETITVSKLEDDGSFLAENFIKKVYKNEKGEEVTVVRDKNGRITETVKKSENESVTTIYNTPSVHIYDNFKDQNQLQLAQVMVKNGEEYFVLYDENGNTVTHAANNDSISKLLKHLGFENIEQLYQLNPKLKNPKHVLKVGDPITVPGHRDVTAPEIQNQGSIAGETQQYVKAYNEKVQREFLENLENFRKDNFSKMNKEVFDTLNKVKGFELTNENTQMYMKISLLPESSQKKLVNDIKSRVEKGEKPDSIKEFYLNTPFVSVDGKNLTTINLFDGPTIELPSFSNPATMHIGNFIKNCDTELLFNETENQTKNFSVKTFFQKVLGLDITKGEGKVLYEQFIKINDPLVMMDINAMFANIARRTSSNYKQLYTKAQKELTDSYKQTIIGQGISEALNANKPLSQTEARRMFISVIQSMTAPKGQHVRTNYDSFINDHKDFYLRKFATEMVAFLYNRNGEVAQQTSKSKSILNPVGKLTLGFLAPRYSKDAQSIHALMTSDCYMGNKKLESTIKGYDTSYPGYDREKVKKCWEIMQNPNATEEQKMKALGDAFGHNLVHSAENLSSVCNFADGVTDIILLMYGTSIIGKGLQKIISFIPRTGSVVVPTEAMITGSKGMQWTQRLTSVGISSATFSIYDSAKFAVDYYSSDMYTSNNISFGEGITSAAVHSAIFGGFASVWGQAVTGNVLKWLFKSPQGLEAAQETMRLMTNQFKNTSKMSGKQVLSAFQGAQAKAVSTAGKEIVGFGSEVIGFSTYELLQKAYNGQLEDASLTAILSGQLQTLLSFKAVGKILFMHKAGKLPQDAIKIDSSKDVSIEPVKKDGVTQYKVTYPDGKTVTVPDMQSVVAVCNRHYEDISIYEPLDKVLDSEKKLELDDGISVTKDENGYSVEFANGEKVTAKNLREVMAQAQAKYQLIQYKDKLQTDGVCELPNGQKITLDRKTGEFLTTLTSGTKIYADNLEQLLQNASETQLCENIEVSLAEQDGKMFLDEKTFLEKKGENDYELKIVLDNGSVVDITGKTIKEVMSKANTVKQFVDLFKTDKAQEDNVSQEQKPIFGIDETVIVEQKSRILGYADSAEFECTKDGVIQILELFNERISSLSHAANYKVYNQFHIDNILKLFEKDPEFVMGLLKEQLQVKVGKHISDYILSPQQIQVLMQMREDYPDIYDKLPIRDEQTGEIRNGLTDFSSARQFFIAYNKNPELTMELVNQRYKDGKELRFRFFDFKELNQAVQNIDSNPLLREALDAKVVDTKGNEFYAHTFKDIRDGLLIDFAGSKEKALMQLKTNDGKYNLFSHEDIQMLIKRDIDVLIEELKDPQKAENAKKELMIILADLKLDAAVSQRVKALYDTEANRFIKEHIPDDAYAVDIGELYVDGTYEVRALTKDGVQTTRFYYKPELFHSAELIANEEVISQDEHSTTVRTEFADGRVIIDKFEKDTYDVYGKSVSYVTKQTRTEYDKDGEPVYEEVITPSKLVAGEMDITSADRVNGRVSTAQTQMFGQKIPLIQSHKKLTSPNGVTTETFVTQEEGCRKSSYVIKDADNNVILNVERQHFQVDENNYISFVNGQKYDIKFESGKITVVKEGVNGESSETITIDTKNIDPRLINLFKQLPGDFLFVYKKAGITSVTVSSTANKNGAYYSPNDRSIVVSKEMLNDPFVLAHELGHAMDELLLGELSNDEVLREIFDKELSAYRNRVSDAEGRIIDYFSTKIHYSGNNLMEVVAEVNAILSGFRTSDSPLFMRGLKLMQNFPETIKYVSDKLATAKDMEAVEPQNQNTGVRLGMIENMHESETITVYDALEVEVSNLKTKEDAFIVLEGLNEHRAELSQEQYTQLETKIKEFITDNDHKLSPEAIQHKGLELEPWEQKSARLEIERRIRVAALEKMKVSEFSPLGARLDSMIDTLDVKNESDVARFKELLASNGLADFEREYLQTLLDNRLNPPTVKNYKPEQIAAEAQHLVRHYKLARDGARTEGEKTPASIVYQTHKIGLRNLGRSSQRVKSDTSTYDKLFNYMNEHKKDGATLIDALKDVRDEFGSRSVIEAGDYSDKPNVKLWLDAANEEGITPEKRRERLIQAAREAALYQSEELFLTLQDQMIQQAAMPNGLKGVRMVNYASADGVPVLSETQLWELHRLAEELGLDNDHIQIIELKEVLYPNGEIQVQAKDIFNKKVMDSGEYTTHSQKSGYTAFQMNFETQNGDWIEFQCRDVYTDEFGEAEHLIYDTLTGKDIIGRTPELKPIYDQLLEVLDENHLRKDVCKKYRQEYLKDYYTYCRAKSLGIDIGEPQLQEYAKRFGEELGIPDLKLDPRLEAKNLMKLHEIAENIKGKKCSPEQGLQEYQRYINFSEKEKQLLQRVDVFIGNNANISQETIQLIKTQVNQSNFDVIKNIYDILSNNELLSPEEINQYLQQHISKNDNINKINSDYLSSIKDYLNRGFKLSHDELVELLNYTGKDSLKQYEYQNYLQSGFTIEQAKELKEGYSEVQREKAARFKLQNSEAQKGHEIDITRLEEFGLAQIQFIQDIMNKITFDSREDVYNSLLEIISKTSRYDLDDLQAYLEEVGTENISAKLKVIRDDSLNRDSIDLKYTITKDKFCRKENGDYDAVKVDYLNRIALAIKNVDKDLSARILTANDIDDVVEFMVKNDKFDLEHVELACQVIKDFNIDEVDNILNYITPTDYDNIKNRYNNEDALSVLHSMSWNNIEYSEEKFDYFIKIDKAIKNLNENSTFAKFISYEYKMADYMFNNPLFKNNMTYEQIAKLFDDTGIDIESLKKLNDLISDKDLKCNNIAELALLFQTKPDRVKPIADFLQTIKSDNYISIQLDFKRNYVKINDFTNKKKNFVNDKLDYTKAHIITKSYDIDTLELKDVKEKNGTLLNYSNEATLYMNEQVKEHDYANNTYTESSVKRFIASSKLKGQTIQHFDEKGELLYTEVWKLSDVKKNALDIYYEYPNGQRELISSIEKNEAGDIIIEKTLTSSNGDKTNYVAIEGNGGSLRSYEIKDKDNNLLLNRTQKTKIIDENHYSTETITQEKNADGKLVKDTRKYDVAFENDIFTVTDKSGLQIEIKLDDIVEGGSRTKKYFAEILKQIPAEDLVLLKEMGIRLKSDYKHWSACFDGTSAIVFGPFIKNADRVMVFLHEFNHAKDHKLTYTACKATGKNFGTSDITYDKEFRELYEEEANALYNNTARINEDFLDYFLNSLNSNEKNRPLNEFIAETGAIQNIDLTNSSSLRAQLLQQNFPKTIAYLTKKIAEYQNAAVDAVFKRDGVRQDGTKHIEPAWNENTPLKDQFPDFYARLKEKSDNSAIGLTEKTIDDLLKCYARDSEAAEYLIFDIGLNPRYVYRINSLIANGHKDQYIRMRDMGIFDLIKDGKLDPDVLDNIGENTYFSEPLLKDVIKQYRKGESSVTTLEDNINPQDIANYVENGETVEINGQLYVNNNGKPEKLNISKEMFEKLFPLIDRFDFEQGELGNCGFISTLSAMMDKPGPRIALYRLFTQEGNDIILKFPGSKETIRFKNGEAANIQKQNLGTKAMDMIVQAFAITKHNKYKIGAHETDASILLEHSEWIEQTTEAIFNEDVIFKIYDSNSFTDILFSKDFWKEMANSFTWAEFKDTFAGNESVQNEKRRKKQTDIIEKYANDPNATLFVGLYSDEKVRHSGEVLVSSAYDLYSGHAYAIKGYNKQTGMVQLTNPWRCGLVTEVPLDFLLKQHLYIGCISTEGKYLN